MIFVLGHEVYQVLKNEKQIKINLIQEVECDLQQGQCQFKSLCCGMMILAITPRPIMMNEELKVVLTTERPMPKDSSIDFMGVEMKMGYNRPSFVQDTPKHYSLEALLPMCTQDEMTWQATLLIPKKNELNAYQFKFITERP